MPLILFPSLTKSVKVNVITELAIFIMPETAAVIFPLRVIPSSAFVQPLPQSNVIEDGDEAFRVAVTEGQVPNTPDSSPDVEICPNTSPLSPSKVLSPIPTLPSDVFMSPGWGVVVGVESFGHPASNRTCLLY